MPMLDKYEAVVVDDPGSTSPVRARAARQLKHRTI
jgi:hypothetical protein